MKPDYTVCLPLLAVQTALVGFLWDPLILNQQVDYSSLHFRAGEQL